MTARVVVVGTAQECADVLDILRLAADVTNVEIGPERDGRVCVTADVLPDACVVHDGDEGDLAPAQRGM